MTEVKLSNVRHSFPSLWKATQAKVNGVPKGDPKFRDTFLVGKGTPQAEHIEKVIADVAREKWGKKAEEKLAEFRGDKRSFSWRDGDEEDRDGYENCMALMATSPQNNPPKIYDNVKDAETGKYAVLTEADGRPYAGCYVNAIVDIYATDLGVFASLKGVQWHKKGDAFAGRPAASEDFDDFADVGEDEEQEEAPKKKRALV